MADRLIVDGEHTTWRIAWFLADEGDIGAVLGEGPIGHDIPSTDDENWSHRVATLVVSSSPGCQRDHGGFYFETRLLAQAAMKAANATIKNKPLADFEKKALAAGWKPPKGRM
jgi:hypothetical protein